VSKAALIRFHPRRKTPIQQGGRFVSGQLTPRLRDSPARAQAKTGKSKTRR
jgi:hypothetical protein